MVVVVDSGGQWCGGWKIAKTAQPQDANVLHSRPPASSEIGSAIPIYSFITT